MGVVGRQVPAVGVLAFDIYGTLYDLASLAEAARGLVPDPVGFVELWRAKQLEYALLLSVMGRYESFRSVTERALRYTIKRLGLGLKEREIEILMEAWLRLKPYPDAARSLPRLAKRHKLVALTNGDRDMVDALLRNTGLGHTSPIYSRRRRSASSSRVPRSTGWPPGWETPRWCRRIPGT
jgi:2-haloacid dehalogenase